jgi:formate dehydrogenase maturation protein FdhE
MPSKAAKKSLGDLLKQAKATAAAKPRTVSRAIQPPLAFTTIALTPSAKEILGQLADQVEEHTGRKVSASAIVRALLQVAEQRQLTKYVTTAVETELNTGAVVWGKSRKER